jgi:DNA-directed RNA polymerase specialized sigma24 family protein
LRHGRYYDTLRGCLSRKTGDHAIADDIAARAFERLWRWEDRGRAVTDPQGFVWRAALGLLVDHWRTESRREEFPAGLGPELDSLAIGSSHTYEDALFTESFDSALRALPEPERGAFILTELRGLTVREASAHTDTPPTTVFRASEAARTYIAKEIT